ncbi:hypothetical protein [Sedimenticola sp.]|uniref:hypothetical protein n=1 Tax=Sedimenticola sp. TaxID=1940285 RepID=UPI003D0DC391
MRILFAFIMISMLSAIACAEEKNELQMKAESEFKTLDSNQDGLVAKDEAEQNMDLAQSFATVDVDQNGVISVEEYILYKGDAAAAGMKEHRE